MVLGPRDLANIIFFSLTSIISVKQPEYCAFVDLEKAFDWVDRDLLLYALLKFNVDGKVYSAIKAMYKNTFSCLKINNFLTDWFEVNSGVRQGDTLSPTLFAIHINSLDKEIKELGLGIDINGNKVSILLYADDSIYLSEIYYNNLSVIYCTVSGNTKGTRKQGSTYNEQTLYSVALFTCIH